MAEPAEAAAAAQSGLLSSVATAEEMNPSYRSTMEDTHRVCDPLGGNADHALLAVYDGHGGRDVAEFIETRLDAAIARELADGDGSMPERLTRAFVTTDMEAANCTPSTAGATAVVALVVREGGSRTLWVANCGDGRAVLCQGGSAVRLSYDHKAEDAGERQRITDKGGFMLRNRVLGILAVSRSFGDHGMKQFVVADPYVSETALGATDEHPFVILACDGLWDVTSDQQAVDIVLGCEDRAAAADALMQHALSNGTTDNVTIVVSFF